ncbi:uncharacterized protein [Dendrobates tinctorius]|uniref:uncharacterized protein n=1 Tax=Dendrobates tinctorius TaxID=92724 RepID=UPI003CC9FD10
MISLIFLTGKHEDAPMVKKRDVIENANISTPDRDYAVINIEPDKDVVISSDRKHEDKTKIVTDDAPHGPMVEKRDNLKSTMIPIPDAGDKVINMGPDEDVVTTSNKKHENILIIGNGEAARRPMAEESDNLQNTEINKQWVREKIANFEANQNVIIDSDRKHEKLNIGNYYAPRGPIAEKSDIKNTEIKKQWLRDKIAIFETEKSDNLKNSKINKQCLRDKIAKFEARQNVINSDRKHENKRIIGNVEAACGPMAEKGDKLKNTKIKKQWLRDKIAKFEARQKVIIDSDSRAGCCCEPSIYMGSSWRRLDVNKKRQIPGSVSVVPHWI